mgnify:CR=1 FL=1
MKTNEKFIETDVTQSHSISHSRNQGKGVLKNKHNRISGMVHLNPQDEDLGHGVEFFQPITEGDLIVGVIHKCACGKTSELSFQYSDS